MKKVLLLFVLGVASFNFVNAQTDSSGAEAPNKARGGATKFLLAGKAEISWVNTKTKSFTDPLTNTVVPAGPSSHTFFPDALMLMPLVKVNKHLFLDAQIEVDPNATGGGSQINLVEMIAYYRLSPGASVFAGNFSPKYGLFLGVLDDFTNRYTTDPVGMARGPQTQTGLGIQGGVQTGYSKINYQVYLSNGPQHTIDTSNMGTANITGQLNYDNYADNNNNKAVGGSIGWLPFSNSSLQVDLSGQYAGKTGADGNSLDSLYPNSTTSWAVDLNYYTNIRPFMIRLQGEFNNTSTKNYNYQNINVADTVSGSPFIPAFDNKFSGWYGGITLRATGVESTFLNNLELGGRIGAYTPPKYTDASITSLAYPPTPWDENSKTQTTICLTYWFTWKTPLNFAYDIVNEKNRASIRTYQARLIYFF